MAKKDVSRAVANGTENGRCCICGDKYEFSGNSAWPVMNGRCCQNCNDTVVMRARKNRLNRFIENLTPVGELSEEDLQQLAERKSNLKGAEITHVGKNDEGQIEVVLYDFSKK
ncbi:MAG: hypothetical protein J5953_03785 [Prevotella sp.]|nr:hypothetical protein [Prevotella sp.]MBO5630329.1 hypothetical protein [Aeriscardovia sp.]